MWFIQPIITEFWTSEQISETEKDSIPKTYGPPQVAVSALTALRLCEWLTTAYFVEDCPPAKCWLLLSATDEEVRQEPRLSARNDGATFDACESALRYSHHELLQVGVSNSENSRSMFFFSGHGFESNQEQQTLLPSDYLAPPARNKTG